MFVRILLYCILICITLYIIVLAEINLALNTLKTKDYSTTASTVSADSHLLEFKKYVKDFNKTYSTKMELAERYKNFKASLGKIAKLNAVETNAVFGLTKFADMSEQEMSTYMLPKDKKEKTCYEHTGDRCEHSKKKTRSEFTDKVHDRLDWRESNVIGPVLDQKECQGCWAISVAGVMESMARIQKVAYEDLSIQEILDCFLDQSKDGCRGHSVYMTLLQACRHDWRVIGAKRYPLTLRTEDCQISVEKQNGIRLTNFTRKCKIDEKEDLQRVLMHGPATAIVNAEIWHYYLGGIIQRACVRSDDSQDHAIQIVGYDKTGEIPYYIVKNSWGEDFGIDGYVKLEMGKNMCGIAEDISYLEVEKVSA